MKWILPLAVLVGATFVSSPAAAAAEFYVAPDGNDDGPGCEARPWATLAGARDGVRAYRARHGAGDVTVHLRGGTYRLSDTVVFSREDSGGRKGRTTYAACPGERPVLSAGVPVTAWRKPDIPPPNLPEAARAKVWVADVSFVREKKSHQAPAVGAAAQDDRPWQFLTLYAGDRRLPRARGPGFSPTASTDRGSQDRQTLHFPPGALRNWPGLGHAELVIIPMHFWVGNVLPLESVDESAGIARTARPGTYPLGRNAMRDRDVAWVENVLEVLDEPGEWVLDPEKAVLYLWPLGDRPGDDVSIPLLTEMVRVEGRIDYDGPDDVPVENLAFRGITFTHGDRLAWHGGTGWGLQHDWERFDSPSAMLRLRGAQGCTVEDCHFVNAGGTGLRLDLTCRENRVVGNHFERLGGVAVLLAGYGPGTKDVNRRNEVMNNYIHHVGRTYWGSPAVFAWQSGENRIAHNHIHHAPYTGICVTGRIRWDPKGVGECSRTVRWEETGVDPAGPGPALPWHARERFLHARRNRVERNEIHNVMEVTGDGNCIYVSGAGGGNLVRENYCHDCTGRYMNAAIRCDDDQHETTIERNVIHRTGGHGEGIISKGDNDVLGNVVADLRPQDRHRGYLVFPYGSPKGSVIRHNVFYSCRAGQTVCYEGSARGGTSAPRLRDTEADFNVYFCTEDPEWGERHLAEQRRFGIETHSVAADPRFADAGAADFRFLPGSPALALGIEQPIAVEQTGLESPYRERWLGDRLTTTIRPGGGVLRRPIEITMRCNRDGAEIRYTLDGTEPIDRSARYAGPFALDRPAVVRARAFAPGAVDLVGAEAEFAAPPRPIREDFESCRVGEPAPGAETTEEDDRHTARVSDEQAASGRHSLKFVDGPGQKHAFNPHVVYRVGFDTGRLAGRFRILLDPRATFHYQWRDYQTGGYRQGPAVQIREGGAVFVGARQVATVPIGRWVTFEVTAAVGESATGLFDLRVQVDGDDESQVFGDLPYVGPLEKVDWLGLVANGREATTFFVDDVELGEVAAPE